MIRVISKCNLHLSFLLKKIIIFLFFLGSSPLQAQIINDSTLPVNSQINLNGNTFEIEGGTVDLNQVNLFHSFSEFSVPTNFEAFFNNALAIENIFARVNGSKLSNIDGLIRANGSANLFLLNPNGILFGSNASIDIGGSFIATTADSVVFSNGSEFSASKPQTISPLTVNIPIGLRFRQNQGVISIQNTGHQLFRIGENPFELILSPILGRELAPGLKVGSGNTLAFVGGSVVLDGGILTAEEGHVELGSIYSGMVDLNPTSPDWGFDYSKVDRFGNIQLERQALVDVSGNQSGSIQIQGRKVSLNDGSTIFSQNQGIFSGRNIEIRASEILEITGISSNGLITSQITSVTEGIGSGGDIKVITPKLFARDGGRIGTLVLAQGSGKGGNIVVNASESIDLLGTSLPLALRASQIITETNSFAFGQAGDISISTGRLTLLNGGNIVAGLNIGNGSTNLVKIEATEFILVEGISSLNFVPSIIGHGSLAGTGNIGKLFINTPKLIVRDGGNINTSVLGAGNAGDIVINAVDSLEIRGHRSELISAATRFAPEVAIIIGLPETPTGISGNVTINTPRLIVTDGGQVTVRHDGTGSAGSLIINTDSIFLDNNIGITASTESGEGGNITLNVSDIIELRNDSLISSTASGRGNGGNVNINSPLIAVFPPTGANGSDIIAKAETGDGGSITINSEGIFGITEGLAIPENQSNDIDASSEFGASGQVEITNNIDPNQGVVQLPETVVDPNTLVTQNACRKGYGSQFTLSGRGGLPPSVNEDLNTQATQVGLVEPILTNLENKQTTKVKENQESVSSQQKLIVPAQGWIFNEKGEVVLLAYNPSVTGVQRLKENIPGCPVP